MEFDEMEKVNNKSQKVLFIILLVVLVILTFVILYKPASGSTSKKENTSSVEENTSSVEENKNNYKLVKLTSYNENIKSIRELHFFDDYFSISGYNKIRQSYFYLFKNDEKVDLGENIETAYVSRVGNLNKYYAKYSNETAASIVDITGKNTNVKKYDYIHNYKGNLLYVEKDDKEGIIDADGKIILDVIYDEIESYYAEKYSFVILKDKVGIANFYGKIIIPIEYGINKKLYDKDYVKNYGEIVEDEKTYFILNDNNGYLVLDENNNVIIRDKRLITYDSLLNCFVINKPNTRIYEYYNVIGELVKVLNYDAYSFGDKVWAEFDIERNKRLFADKNDLNIVYAVDQNFNITKYSDVHHIINEVEVTYTSYYINEYIYLSYKNEKYILKSIKDNSIIGNYSFFEIKSFDNENIILACENEKSCGLIDQKGKKLTLFNYELVDYDESRYSILLKNDQEMILLAINTWKKITCNSNLNIIKNTSYVYDHSITNNRYFLNDKCEKINEKVIRNHRELDNGFIVAEIMDSEIKEDYAYYYDYYIINENGTIITYDNPDNAKLKQYITFNDNKTYFLTDKGIYYLVTK